MKMAELLAQELADHTAVLEQTCIDCADPITQIVAALVACFQSGHKVLLCGNGGSAADAQHVAAEFVNRFKFERPALPAIALTVNTSNLTAISNDSSYNFVFSRQVEALAQPGDVLVGISTSGGAVNVLTALDAARTKGVTTIGFTGARGIEKMTGKCDLCIVIPAADTARIQEAHEFVWHIVCGEVERTLFRA